MKSKQLYTNNIRSKNLTNFLPLIVTNLLKKGEKEKTFVKVNKVLQRLKKNIILNHSFLLNRRIFLNKIFFYGLKKRYNFFISSNILKNHFYFLNFSKKIRQNHDFLIKVRVFFFLSNLYSYDFFAFERYNIILQNEIKKNYLLLKKDKARIRFLVKKKILNLIFSFIKSKFNFLKKKLNLLLINNTLLNTDFFDLKFIISHLIKNIFLLKNILKKNNYFLKIFFYQKNIFKNQIKLSDLKKFVIKKKIFLNDKKKIKKNKKIKKYYYLNNQTKLLQKESNKLNKKYFLLKKINKKLNRFEFKKRKYIYIKLKKAYKKSKSDFFRFKRKISFLKKKKLKKKAVKNFNNLGSSLGLKLIVIKKSINIKKNLNRRKVFFKYSIFPNLFAPIKFLNVILSKYRLYFTFREQRLWGKHQLIPNILNLKRDLRITVRNFKKSLQDIKFSNVDLQNSFYESLLYAGSKKGFLLKIKQQAYVFMLKNAIFLQFMIKRRKNTSRRKRRKKIDKK
jgi:hypothetical protein